jgi:hypothetical protein
MSSVKTSFLKCSLCKLSFNLKNREPINLMCCGEVACRHCVENVMMKSQSKELVIKGQFDCSLCHSDHCAPKGFKDSIEHSVNKHIRK